MELPRDFYSKHGSLTQFLLIVRMIRKTKWIYNGISYAHSESDQNEREFAEGSQMGEFQD